MTNIINRYQTNDFNLELIKYYYYHYIKLNTIGTSSWDGNIIKRNMDKIFAVNLYNFLKNNYDYISKLGKKDLENWFNDSNMYIFIDLYYQKEINDIKKYIKNVIEISKKNKEFFEKIKNNYELKHGNSIIYKLERIHDSYDNKDLIYIDNNLLVIIDNNIENKNQNNINKNQNNVNKNKYNIKSLQEICVNNIEKYQKTYDIIINIFNKLFSKDTEYLDNMLYVDLEDYIKIVINDYSNLYECNIFSILFLNCFKRGQYYDFNHKINMMNDIKDMWKSINKFR
jgi:ferritin-like protein